MTLRNDCFDILFHHPVSFSAVFTNLGASGRLGPTSLGSYYSGQDHDGQVTLHSGIQQWTVPKTGDYRIEAIGAAGGYDNYNSNSSHYRGRGARMKGTFSLSRGETIQILVGQEGGINNICTKYCRRWWRYVCCKRKQHTFNNRWRRRRHRSFAFTTYRM